MTANDDMEARLKGVEGRLERVEGKLERVESRLERVEGRLDRVEGRLVRVEDKVDGLTIQVEDVRADIKKLGEGYEQGLQGISRDIKELSGKWDAKWATHDMALQNHAKRIVALEGGRRATRRRQ